MEKSLTILIPAYNESRRIISTLTDIDNYISNSSNSFFTEVIIIDDGSTDGTKETAKSWIQSECKNKKSFQVTSYYPNQGKGYAVRKGILKASGDLVLYTDADGASPIKEAEKLISAINDGFDIVCGSRILKDKDSVVKMSIKRRFVGFVFQSILKLLNLADLKDTQCGFKLFKSEAAKNLAEHQKCFNYSFDIEYLFLAKKLGYKIKELPINWSHVEGSKINILSDSIKMLNEVLKIRFVYKYN